MKRIKKILASPVKKMMLLFDNQREKKLGKRPREEKANDPKKST